MRQSRSRRDASWLVGTGRKVRHEINMIPDATTIDAGGSSVVPGFVDPHTHLVFGGDRREELQRRLAGATYAEIAAEGGGSSRPYAATRVASEDELVAGALPRLRGMLACGTTTAEAKSGYGLETAAELRILRAIRRLANSSSRSSCRRRSWAPTKCLMSSAPAATTMFELVIDEMIPGCRGGFARGMVRRLLRTRSLHARRVARAS